jgi:hypothetical protein
MVYDLGKPNNPDQLPSITHLFLRDTVATVLAAEWPLQTAMFDGDVASGPVPHLFAISPMEAKAAVSADPAKTFRDLQRIWSKLFIPENLAAAKSWDYLNNTRYYPNSNQQSSS